GAGRPTAARPAATRAAAGGRPAAPVRRPRRGRRGRPTAVCGAGSWVGDVGDGRRRGARVRFANRSGPRDGGTPPDYRRGGARAKENPSVGAPRAADFPARRGILRRAAAGRWQAGGGGGRVQALDAAMT